MDRGVVARGAYQVLTCQHKEGGHRHCPHVAGLKILHPLLGIAGSLLQHIRGLELQQLWSMVQSAPNCMCVCVVVMACMAENISSVKGVSKGAGPVLCKARQCIKTDERKLPQAV